MSREDELATAGKNPLADWSNDRLVAAAYVRGATPPQAAEVEMMRRLRVSIDKQTASSNDLDIKLEWLNFWLLIFTIAIFALTGALTWVDVKRRGLMIAAIYAALVFVLALASSASAEMRGARR